VLDSDGIPAIFLPLDILAVVIGSAFVFLVGEYVVALPRVLGTKSSRRGVYSRKCTKSSRRGVYSRKWTKSSRRGVYSMKCPSCNPRGEACSRKCCDADYNQAHPTGQAKHLYKCLTSTGDTARI